MNLHDTKKIHADLCAACDNAKLVHQRMKAHAATLTLPDAPPVPLAAILRAPEANLKPKP